MSEKNSLDGIEIPDIKGNVEQMISDAIISGPAVQKMITESEGRDREKRTEERRFWLGLIIGFVFGIVASYVASYLWWSFGPDQTEQDISHYSTQDSSDNSTDIK